MAEKIKCPYCGKEIVTRKDKISKKYRRVVTKRWNMNLGMIGIQ